MKFTITISAIDVELEPTDAFVRLVRREQAREGLDEDEAIVSVIKDHVLALPDELGFAFD